MKRILKKPLRAVQIFGLLVATTMGLNAQTGTIQIGSGTSTGSTIPVAAWDVTYSQQIVTASEYGAGNGVAGNITKIRWMFPNIGTIANYGDWDVYIGHTTKTSFASNTDWVPIGDLTQVFSGNIHTLPLPPTANQWFEIEFSTPFNYDGVSNIVVAVNEKTPGWSGSPSKRSYTSGANTGIYARKDGTPPYDPANPPEANLRTNSLPQLQFEGQLATCFIPTNLSFTQTSMTGVDISWTTNGSNVATYDVEWGTAGFSLGSGTQQFGLTTTSLSVTTIQDQDYELYVRQNCTGSDGSSAWVGPFALRTGHCAPQGLTTTTTYYVSAFSTTNADTDLNYTANSAVGYVQETATPFSVTAGVPFDWSISASSSTNYFYIWVDWDNNGLFDETPVYASSAYEASPKTGSYTVDPMQAPGNYLMRIANAYLSGSSTTPCGPNAYGNYVDFTMVVQAPVACSGTPTGGTATPNPATANAGDTFSVTASGYDTSSDLTFQWEIYNENTANWDPIGTVSAVYSNLTGQIAPVGVGTQVKYRLKTTCTNSNLFAYSDEAIFETSIVYCIPTQGGSEYIASVSTDGADVELSNLNNGAQTGGYGDFTALPFSVSPGGTFDITVTAGFGSFTYQEAFAIWIDLNNNGEFEASELQYATSVISATPIGFTTTLTAPSTEGSYRMRIVMRYNQTLDPGDSCISSDGETEDYTLVVNVASSPCSAVTALGTSNVTQTSVEVAWTAGGTETAWNIEYGVTGFSQGSGTTVNGVTNPYTITGLTAGTSYDVYVQADCGSGDESTWVMTSFTTNAAFSCPSPLNPGMVLTTPDSGSAGSTFDVTATGYDTGADITYTWEKSEDNGANWTIVGTANATTYTDLIGETAPDSGIVEYRLTVSCGGSTQNSSSATFTVTVSRSDFDVFGFSYYPNPVNDMLHFSSNATIENVVITNMLGQQVSVLLSSDNKNLDMSNLPTGNYLVKITIEGVAKTIKVIKN